MKKWMIMFCVIALSACATKGPVIPGPNGVYSITGSGWNDEDALKLPLEQAQAECAAKGQRHVILKIESNYDNRGGNFTAYKKQVIFKCEA
ncbi:MAG: hypothetical protein V4448_18005 [Pseudomonadota bacterium]